MKKTLSNCLIWDNSSISLQTIEKTCSNLSNPLLASVSTNKDIVRGQRSDAYEIIKDLDLDFG